VHPSLLGPKTHLPLCSLPRPAGLLPFTLPTVPQSLRDGYNEEYTRKDEVRDAAPVEVLVRAALSAGVQLPAGANLVSFRNNLNKVFRV
jgi:hypothetical protein